MKAVLAVLISGALPLLTGQTYRHDWRDITPVIHSGVQRLELTEMQTLLSNFCTGGIRKAENIGLKCSTADLGPAFSDIVGNQFYPQAVVYGHFLSAGSEDAVVSGWSAETHPSLWGGTLLLTKRNDVWTPAWYTSAIITHSCQKVTIPSRREILVCEDRDGGMGHKLHYVYSVDLLKPMDRRVSPLAMADSFQSSCVLRKQQIKRLRWIQSEFRLAITIATPEWRRLSRQTCAGEPTDEPRPPLESTLVFYLYDAGFRQIQSARQDTGQIANVIRAADLANYSRVFFRRGKRLRFASNQATSCSGVLI
jgi:hypothetical protein